MTSRKKLAVSVSWKKAFWDRQARQFLVFCGEGYKKTAVMNRWASRQETAEQEKFLLKRLTRVKKLFAFLRMHRMDIFDEAFQEELEASYRQSGAGLPDIAPANLCMAVLLQSYVGASDAEAVELTVVDLRCKWF